MFTHIRMKQTLSASAIAVALLAAPFTVSADYSEVGQPLNAKSNAAAQMQIDINEHVHPKNECTNSISHTHPNGQGNHAHHYSCKGNATTQKAPATVAPMASADTHTHPAHTCTNSVTHTHPNGAGQHQHHYSCDPNAAPAMDINTKMNQVPTMQEMGPKGNVL